MPNLTFTIGEVATLLGITPKTIKHYHEIGLLPVPTRDANHYRRYDLVLIMQLQQILRLKAFGLSLQQIEILVKSEEPNDLLPIVLDQHANAIRDEIAHLQQQLALTEDFLSSKDGLFQVHPAAQPRTSALMILSETIKPYSTSVADILVEIERDVMLKLDQFHWHASYEVFWHLIGKQLMHTLTHPNEGQFIFWMERYLALGAMDADDLQGAAWLNELHQSPARVLLTHTLMPTPLTSLHIDDQRQILKLLSLLLYHEGSALQKRFLTLLIDR